MTMEASLPSEFRQRQYGCLISSCMKSELCVPFPPLPIVHFKLDKVNVKSDLIGQLESLLIGCWMLTVSAYNDLGNI